MLGEGGVSSSCFLTKKFTNIFVAILKVFRFVDCKNMEAWIKTPMHSQFF